MLNRAPRTAGLEKARVDALAVLDDLDPVEDTADYNKVMDQIQTLSNLIAAEGTKPLDMNTVFLAGANVLGIVMIVGHERANLITSKAMSFVGKFR